MPILNDPNASFAYSLTAERDQDIKIRPVFFFRTLSVRRFRAMAKTITQFQDGVDNDEVFGAAITLVSENLTDWINIKALNGNGLPFDERDKKGMVEDILSCSELMELAFAVINQKASPEDKKKLSSPSTPASASAEAEPAGAPDPAIAHPTQ